MFKPCQTQPRPLSGSPMGAAIGWCRVARQTEMILFSSWGFDWRLSDCFTTIKPTLHRVNGAVLCPFLKLSLKIPLLGVIWGREWKQFWYEATYPVFLSAYYALSLRSGCANNVASVWLPGERPSILAVTAWDFEDLINAWSDSSPVLTAWAAW